VELAKWCKKVRGIEKTGWPIGREAESMCGRGKNPRSTGKRGRAALKRVVMPDGYGLSKCRTGGLLTAYNGSQDRTCGNIC